jgi:GMP synthase-like glutamine amidotransferase
MSSEDALHIAILSTNTDQSDFARRHPPELARFGGMLRLARPAWQFTGFDCVAGALPGAPGAFDGYVITGSPASANDPDRWVAGLKAFIRATHAAQVPMFGACYGHQVIAVALGGVVEESPGGWRFGAYEGHLGTADGGGPIRLYAAHKEQVTRLPTGAAILGGTPDCPVGAYRIGGHIFSTQYHPEFPPAFMADMIDSFADEMPVDVVDRARQSLSGGPAEMARFAEGVAAFFEAAVQDKAASRSIAVT